MVCGIHDRCSHAGAHGGVSKFQANLSIACVMAIKYFWFRILPTRARVCVCACVALCACVRDCCGMCRTYVMRSSVRLSAWSVRLRLLVLVLVCASVLVCV